MTLVNSRKASKVVRTQVVAVNKRTGERCINCSVKTFKSKPKGNFSRSLKKASKNGKKRKE